MFSNGLNILMGNKIIVSTTNSETAEYVKKLLDLEQLIEEEYYEDVSLEDLFEGAYKGLFEGTGDPYSIYYTEEEFTQLKENFNGEYVGVGIVVTEDEYGVVTVISPYENYPAAEAGIIPGDKIIKVNGEDVTTVGIDEVVSRIRGEEGTEVDLTILRDDEEIDLTVERALIDVESVSSEVLDDDIGYIDIYEFDTKTDTEFNEQLDELLEENIQGLIIDLRYNPGGSVAAVTQIADRLLPEATIIYTLDKEGNRTDYNSTGSESLSIPIVVLVNEGSASASEILSGSLQDNDAATIIGTQTYGKGIVQTISELGDGSGYQVTTETYYLPSGETIHGIGITPDIIVELDEENIDSISIPFEEDNQLQEGIKYLLEEIE
jgi:carboxyl-terminal processing protease